MRLGILALSTILLSGCSWMGGFAGGHSGYNSAYSGGQYGAQRGVVGHQGPAGGCQIFAPTQPVPRGCDPASVTLATRGGQNHFPQSPDFSGGQYVTGGYGSHAAQAGQQSAHYQPKKRMRKPTMRASLSLGAEKSIRGDLVDFKRFPVTDVAATYNPNTFAEASTSGSIGAGQTITNVYSATVENVLRPDISFEDAHSSPINIAGGMEYIMSPTTTLFANAGYSFAEGENIDAVLIDGTLTRTTTTRDYDTDAMLIATGTAVGFIPNQRIAKFNYAFDDLSRVNLEAGARHYFNPILKGTSKATMTPFMSASAGVNHYGAQSYDVTQKQVFFERAFTSGGDDAEFYTVAPPVIRQTVDVYDSQWVPTGAVNAGVEWQVTPKTALALETGIKVEGGRKYKNGARGNENISIPVTLRGSVNF